MLAIALCHLVSKGSVLNVLQGIILRSVIISFRNYQELARKNESVFHLSKNATKHQLFSVVAWLNENILMFFTIFPYGTKNFGPAFSQKNPTIGIHLSAPVGNHFNKCVDNANAVKSNVEIHAARYCRKLFALEAKLMPPLISREECRQLHRSLCFWITC